MTPNKPPEKLVEFMSQDWMAMPPVAATHPQIACFLSRREALSRSFPGCYLFIPAGQEHVRSNDMLFRFRPSSDFVYLMGDGEPGALLVLEPDGGSHRSLLFAREHNRGTAEFFTNGTYGELWVGPHRGVDESHVYFGVDRCESIAQIAPYLEKICDGKNPVRVLRGYNHAIDAQLPESDGDKEFARHLSEMRLVKDEYELAELRKACEITKRGFEDVIRILPTAESEREVEAAFWRRARMEANDVGYLTIAASGENACTLHWNRNTGRLRPDTLLLLDAGVECDSLYGADVTRTLPLSGHFSREQRAVYEIVYEAQRAGIEAVAPGNDWVALNHRVMGVLTEGLIDLGVLRTSLDEALDPEKQLYKRYTLHGISHMLGLDVHDCAHAREEYRRGVLREGMVLTVEPGLYFQSFDATVPECFRGIGVRIEDDIAVTREGRENLSGMIPSRLDAVEDWMEKVYSITV